MSYFSLSKKFIDTYKNKKPPFGFNGLGEIVYLRTYSRIKDDNTNERWYETIERVVNGTYNMQKEWIEKHNLGWNAWQAQKSAQEMYDRMFNMKFLPPGRGLWAMGSSLTKEKKLYASLNNCGFYSTENLKEDPIKPFTFLMDMSMLGVGIGFDTKGAGTIVIKGPNKNRTIEKFIIPDSREGWVESLRLLLESYFHHTGIVDFDYSQIRPAGQLIKGFGGKSSGHEPLEKCHNDIKNVLEGLIDQPITSRAIVDIQNIIGCCVVAGNVRRTAEISFGDYKDSEYLDLKNYKINPDRSAFGWTSNNSIFAELGMDYKNVAERTKINGEPGYAWLDNMKNYSRMNNGPDYKDHRVMGGNPCLEQSLESAELCCVSKDTKIQTKDGIYSINKLVSKEVEVWNGDGWSKVKPFLAGKNKDLYRVHISDGSYLECTGDHKWQVKNKGKRIYKQVETNDLELSSIVKSFEINVPFNGKYENMAFEYGLFSGDGYIDNGRPMLVVCGDKIKLRNLDIPGKWYKPQIKEGYKDPVNRLSFKNVLDFERCKELNDNSKGLPEWVFEMDKDSILNFTAGLIETDGNMCKQSNTDNYRIFGNQEKIRDLQLLLRRVGINNSSIYVQGKKGEYTNFGKRNYDIYCLYIPSYECGEIPTQIKKAIRIGERYKINNAYPKGKKINASRNQKIVKIEKIDGKHDTFCFNEPINHMGVFNNVLTYQCLVETFPNNHKDVDDYKKTLKYAYLYAKTVTLGETHWPDTNRVLLRNRRIGCSMSGVAQFLTYKGIHELKKWAVQGYDHIQDLDKQYSDWLAIPKSIKTTSIKPSGTVSLLVGATPGMHYPESRFYIRRIRIGNNSEMLEPLKTAGYYIEPSKDDPLNTSVVEVPVDVGEGIRTTDDLSIWEQASLASFMQKYWADNQVSCTITFDPEKEGGQIQNVLNYFQYQLKGISFLPKLEMGAYEQMPYEKIDEKKYNELSKKLKKLNLERKKIHNEQANIDVFCDGEKCEMDAIKNTKSQ